MDMTRTEHRYALAGQAVRGLVTLGIAGFTYLCVRELAGQVTVANFLVDVLGLGSVRTVLYLLLLFALAGWAIGENRLRKRVTRHLSSQKQRVEEQIDPDRTSSGLTPTGGTNPGDL